MTGSQSYRTIGADSLRASQLAFLPNIERGEAYQAQAPTLWDVTFRTAVAQAELEDREQPSAYHTLSFHRTDGDGDILIDTTRPELLAACVALVAHPDDERYKPLFGSTVTTPIFGVEVPVVAHHLAQQDKGTGIAMVCTFGDVTDVIWWRELDLPNRAILGFDGRIISEAPEAIASDDSGRDAFAQIAGKTVFSAKQTMVETAPGLRRADWRDPQDQPPGEVLRKGRQAPRDRLHPPVVHQERRPRRGPRASGCSRTARNSPGTPTSCACATRTGSRASRATG